MNSFKIGMILLSFLSMSFFLHAAEYDLKAAKAAPIEIQLGDTADFIFPSLKSQPVNHLVVHNRIVEDTLLPPCDVLFFKSGKIEYCKIIETTPETVTYKMCDYQAGPNIIAYKTSIEKIRYANGREEVVMPDEEVIAQEDKVEKPKLNVYAKPRKDPLAKLSFIFGLSSAGIVLLFGIVFLPLALAGIVLGIISLAKISRRRGELRGTGSATIGLILSALVLILLLL